MFGSAADYEAKYMMDRDVVLVTVAYRLGSFGFLNTEGGSDANGNMGLKVCIHLYIHMYKTTIFK